MARRKLDEINAGSMADIAFLLLVFFLVVTDMNNDQGVPRLLPPPVPVDFVPPEFIPRDVYEVLVNLNNEVYIEDNKVSLAQIRTSARKFLLANGDNVLSPMTEAIDDLPIRSKRFDLDSIKYQVVQPIEAALETLNEEKLKLEEGEDIEALTKKEKEIKNMESDLNKALAIQYALEYFPGFAALPGSAMISVQNDNSTSYDTYLSVNNELEGALNDLRNEVAMNKFGTTYDDLDFEDDEDKKKILAIRQVYPQRISEAEPSDIGDFTAD